MRLQTLTFAQLAPFLHQTARIAKDYSQNRVVFNIFFTKQITKLTLFLPQTTRIAKDYSGNNKIGFSFGNSTFRNNMSSNRTE